MTKWRWADHRQLQTPTFVRDLTVTLLSPFILPAGALLLGIPVYAALRRQMTQPPKVPTYPAAIEKP